VTDTPADTPAEDQTDIDAVEAETQLETARHRKDLLDFIRDTLPEDSRNYAVAPVLETPVRLTYNADGVTAEGGRPRVIGGLLSAIDEFLFQLSGGDKFWLRSLDFKSSVNVVIEPDVPTAIRERAENLRDTDPEGVIYRSTLAELIPDSVAAANAAVRILSMPSGAGLQQARRFSSEVAEAYVRIAKEVDDGDGALLIEAPGNRSTTFRKATATAVVEHSKQREEREPISDITIVGTLTRTDSEEKTLRVVLDRDLLPRVFDARRRVVEGTYSRAAGDQVRNDNLWDKRVIARVTGFPVKEAMRSKDTFANFQFTRVELAP
jgi:hypothetical protein